MARVTGFVRDGSRVLSVKTRSEDGSEAHLEADSVLIAMGPWSGAALQWLGLAPVITGRRAHGIVMRPPAVKADDVTGQALFLESNRGPKRLSSEVRDTLAFALMRQS